MSAFIRGPSSWSLQRDERGYRTYKLIVKVGTTDTSDGPYTVFNTPGLYLPGAAWNIGNDFDSWVWCTPEMSVSPMITEEPDLS